MIDGRHEMAFISAFVMNMNLVAEMDFDGAHGHVWHDGVASLPEELRLLKFEAKTRLS